MDERTLLDAYLCGMRMGYRMSCMEDAKVLRGEAGKDTAAPVEKHTGACRARSTSDPAGAALLERLRARGLM